jgi:pimeloyl-ACP methyl ester carboxylesterase
MLAALGYRVWAPNLRGYGGSDRPKGVAEYRLDTLAADVAALIDASGAKRVTLIAHDWGALIAWHFAIKQLRSLDSLIILNVPHPKCAEREIRKWRQLKKSWYIFFQLPWLPEWILGADGAQRIGRAFRDSAIHRSHFADADLLPYRRAASQPGALTAMLNYYRALLRFPDGRNIGAGIVPVPTLVLWGEQDVALDIHTLDGLDGYVPDLTLRRFADASHWVQQDIPDQINATLAEWLGARTAAQISG